MKHVKQQAAGECGLACVAMLTDQHLYEVRDEAEPWMAEHIGIRYLTQQGIYVLLAQHKVIPIGFAPLEYIESTCVGMNVYCDLTKWDGLITVTSDHDEFTHWVVWDRLEQAVRDPLRDDLRPLRRYDVLEMVLLQRLQ